MTVKLTEQNQMVVRFGTHRIGTTYLTRELAYLFSVKPEAVVIHIVRDLQTIGDRIEVYARS